MIGKPEIWVFSLIAIGLLGGFFVSFLRILSLWIRHKTDSLLRKLLWSIILLFPLIGWVLYGGLYLPPPIQAEDLRAKESSGAP